MRYSARPPLLPSPSPAAFTAAVEVLMNPVYRPYILCLAALACGALWLAWPKKRKVPGFPRVPGRLPVLGNFHQLGGPDNLAEKFEEWVAEFGGEHGVCECSIGGCRYVIVGGHDAVLEIMRQRPYKVRRSAAVSTLDALCGLFHAEGSDWRVQRRVVAPAFGHAHMESYLPAMKKVAGRLVSTWRAGPGVVGGDGGAKGQPILNAMSAYASDVTAIAAFGADLDSVRTSNPIIDDINRVFALALDRTLLYNVFRYWEVLPFGTYLDGMGQALGRITSALFKVVAARAEQHASPQPAGASAPATHNGTGTGTLLDIMMARVALGKGKSEGKDLFTHRTMVDNLVTAFLAGTDTTGIALAWMLHTLALDAQLQAECAAEALQVDVDAADGAELMAKLPAIRSLYWEVNRVNGPVSLLLFEPVEGATVTLQGRTLLPPSQGGRIAISCMVRYANCTDAAGRRAGISNPSQFDPRRWMLPDGSVRNPPMDGYLSFGHGLRVCPGKELSHLEAVVCVAHVLRAFSLALPDGHPKVKSHTKFTQRPDREISLLLTPRADRQGRRTAP